MFSIFFIVGAAVAVALILAMIVTRQKVPASKGMIPPEDDYALDPKEAPQITPEQLLGLGEALCRENQLTIKERMTNNPTEIYWIAESANDFFKGQYVLCFFLVDTDDPFVKLTDILEFKDFVKSIGSLKGFFFTNGYFTKDVHQPLEGPKLALYNRLKVIAERKRLSLS